MKSARKIAFVADTHSDLMRAILNDFAAIFVPGGELIYAGDSGAEWGYFDQEFLASLGVTVDHHEKMPDVVIYDREKNWLILVEAVVATGPIDESRRRELAEMFKDAKAGLVYVTAFPERGEVFQEFLGALAWGTVVWCANETTHMIHFNGTRFFGPYHTP
jgi:type II restriction enzyme